MSKSRWIKKYTKLEHLDGILQHRYLHLGPPQEWDDKNDSECIRLFSAVRGGFEIRATCLTEAVDRFHFWHVFGEREKGVCLWFDKVDLLSDVDQDASLVAGKVQYRTLQNLGTFEPRLLPFLKRSQYRDEQEYRVLRVEAARKTPPDKFEFSACSLKRIYLNPWLSVDEVKVEKCKISKLLGNEMHHVSLLQNRTLKYDPWIKAISVVSNTNS